MLPTNKFFSSMFCKHQVCDFVRNVYGDEINMLNCRSLWKCRKCGAEVKRNFLGGGAQLEIQLLNKTEQLRQAAQAGTKTVDRNIRVTDAVEPFKPLSDDEILWIAKSHGIDVYACNVLGFYTDLISTSPVQAAVAAVHKATGSKKC